MNTENIKTTTRSNIVLKWGLIGGLVSIIQNLAFYFLYDGHPEKANRWASFLIGAVVVILITFMAMKEMRESVLGGHISFGKAYSTGLLTGLVMIAVSTLYSFVFVNYLIDFDQFVVNIIDETVKQMKEKGSSESEISQSVGYIKMMTPVSFMIWGLAMGIIGLLIINLVSAAVAKKDPPRN
jgi:hypothetical protein